MKKFLAVIFAAYAVVSCLGDGPMNHKEYSTVATFEFGNSAQIIQLFGSDSLHFDTSYGLGIQWSDLAFCHKVDDKKEFKGGFILSHLKGKIYSEGYEPDKDVDMFRVNAPADSSLTYMVFVDTGIEETMPVHDVEFLMNEYGSCTVAGCLVNVPLYVAYAAAAEFRDGDALKVVATGYKNGKMTANKSMDLITCEGDKVNIIPMWQVFDLAALGDVQYVEFDVQSTNENVPEVFCMDNFGAKISVSY